MIVEYKGVSYEVPLAEPPQSRDPALLYGPFRRMLEAWLEAAQPHSPHELRMGECRRSLERQVWLYSLGRAQPGRVVTRTVDSRHRHGLAVDLVAVSAEGEAVWDDAFWKKLYRAVPPAYFGLKTLSFERVHVEMAYSDALIARAPELGLYQT